MRQKSLELGAILKLSALGVLNTFIHFQIFFFWLLCISLIISESLFLDQVNQLSKPPRTAIH